MATKKYLSVSLPAKVPTKLGPIFITPTEATHLHVCSSSSSGNHREFLTLRGCEYYVSAHFHAYRDGTFNIGPEFKEDGKQVTNEYDRRQSLYISNHAASESARTKLAEVLTEAVTKWASENPDKLFDAETEHLQNKLDTRIAELADAEKKVAEIKADVKTLRLALEAHKKGGN